MEGVFFCKASMHSLIVLEPFINEKKLAQNLKKEVF